MPTTLNSETFWAQEWLPSAFVVDRLHSILNNSGVATTKELAEYAVRATIESESNEQGYRVYSPEQAYEPGEVIFFLTNEGRRFAKVLYVDPGHSTHLDGHRVDFDALSVRFGEEWDVHRYMSNCPTLPLRFSGKGTDGTSQYMTPATIVAGFYSVIAERLREVLSKDARFAAFCDSWAAAINIAVLSDHQLQQVQSLLRERGSASCSDIAKHLFAQPTATTVLKGLELSVAISLSEDNLKRFSVSTTPEGLVAALTPPPREVVITITPNCLQTGSLTLGRELRKMLDFYQLSSPLTLKVYGDYELRGSVDEELHRICGSDIREWFLENDLEAGHQIHIKAPDPGSMCLRLSTLREIQEPSTRLPGTDSPKDSRKYLRHRIYTVLQIRKQYLHYRDIAALLAEQGVDAKAASIEATLSHDTHLFVKRQPTTGLWGLCSWNAEDLHVDIASTSLLMAIGEEKWVKQVLELSGMPLSAKEISNRLAELFQVRVGQIRDLSFIDVNDPCLLQLSDGRWAIRDWLRRWVDREAQIAAYMQRIAELRRIVAELEGELLKLNNDAAAISLGHTNVEKLVTEAEQQVTETTSRLADSGVRRVNLQAEARSLGDREALLVRRSSFLAAAMRIGTGLSVVSLIAWLKFKNAAILYTGLSAFAGCLCAVCWKSRISARVQEIRRQECRGNNELQSESLKAAELQARIVQSRTNTLHYRAEMEKLRAQSE